MVSNIRLPSLSGSSREEGIKLSCLERLSPEFKRMVQKYLIAVLGWELKLGEGNKISNPESLSIKFKNNGAKYLIAFLSPSNCGDGIKNSCKKGYPRS
ncbi:hypothetical protein CEXT_356151 [Caerostris extrusa]|uniref:Uncharacterized protein n=1 Tax=Caerostris extrusa TaxID=172846 RepID=A0AAV4UIU1_CAEEX|nr:hypothetical protein CEXT_356151 [Caerostris extrusa]